VKTFNKVGSNFFVLKVYIHNNNSDDNCGTLKVLQHPVPKQYKEEAEGDLKQFCDNQLYNTQGRWYQPCI